MKSRALAYFPYEFREGQYDLISFVEAEVRRRNVVVNAPTGFGKTAVILASLLPFAVKEGRQILWVVRTGTETDRPIEELKRIHRVVGGELFGLSFRGKRDMCLLLRDMKLRGELEYDDVSFLCRAHKDDCRYRSNFYSTRTRFSDLICEPRLYTELMKFCEDVGICPYLLQTSLLSEALVVAFSYNYVVDEDVSWAMRRRLSYRSSILVVDEAHNLQAACSSVNSERITLGTLRSALKELDSIRSSKADEMRRFIESLLDYFKGESRSLEDGEDKVFDVHECIRFCAGSLSKFTGMVEALKRAGGVVRRRRLEDGRAPRSSLYRLGSFWLSAVGSLGREGIAYLATREKRNLIVEMWDMRASEALSDVWRSFYRCVFCSGTLRPLDAFAEIIGLERYAAKEIPSFFTEENSLSLVTRGLTTEGEELKPEAAQAYLKAIEGFMDAIDSNVAVFSASYRVQQALIEEGLKELIEGKGRIPFFEYQGMSGRASRETLEGFKACAYRGEKGVLCATMTGRYAEGADFPGRELEGVFLVGIPFDRLTTKTKLYIEYYRRVYGREKGTFYSYILPALRRASQSLGRALRSKEDKAVFILGDERYRRFLSLLPDYVQRNWRMVEGGKEAVEREAHRFWAKRRLRSA